MMKQNRLFRDISSVGKEAIMKQGSKFLTSRKALVACCFALCFAVVLGLAGCGSSSSSSAASSASASSASASASASSSAASDATVEFTDSLGRTVTIPANIERVAVSGAISQQVMFTFAPDLLVGLCDEMNDAEKTYVGEQYASLPVFGQIYGGKGDFNKEAVAAADPQLIIDIGEAKKGIEEDLDALQDSIGVPVVHIEATLGTYGDAYRSLGQLLNRPDRANEIATYVDDAYASTMAVLDTIPAEERVHAAYLLGDAGLNAMAKGTFQAGVIDAVTDNVAVIEGAKGSGLGSETSFEQIALWNPDLILFAPESIYDTVADDPAWQTIAAVESGNFYEVPAAPYNWISTPPSVNQIMGLQWLSRLCYPDKFSDDIATVTKDYYKNVFGYELSDDECNELVAKAVPKA